MDEPKVINHFSKNSQKKHKKLYKMARVVAIKDQYTKNINQKLDLAGIRF